MEFPGDWEGSLGVADAHFDWSHSSYYYMLLPPFLTVNGLSHSVTSSEEFLLTGVHGMVATKTFSCRKDSERCTRVKICSMESPEVAGSLG